MDKQIRVSADTSPIQALRREVEGLTRDVHGLNSEMRETRSEPLLPRTTELQPQPILPREIAPSNIQTIENRDIRQTRIDENNEDIQELVRERSSIRAEGLSIENKERYDSLSKEIESLKEQNSALQREIEDTKPHTQKEESPFDTDATKRRIKENREDIRELNDRRKDIDLSSIDGQIESEKILKEIQSLKATNLELRTQIKDNEKADTADKESKEKTSQGVTNSLLREGRNLLSNLVELATERNRLLGGESSQRQDDNNNFSDTIRELTDSDGVLTRNRREEERRRSSLTEVGTGVTSSLINTTISAAGRSMTARNEYEAAAGQVETIGTAVGGITASIGNALGPLGGAIGGLIGGAVAGISTVFASYASRVVAKTEELERNSLLYTQTIGGSLNRTKGIAFEEGSYAANALGINVGEYIKRRADILRASGGKELGRNEGAEAGSLMAVERLYGINSSSINQLQASMRFATQGGTEFGSSSTSSSGVIRLFENTMRDLKLPFSEIASTMEESLSTFNKTAENVLNKAGEFDAGKVAGVLASVRAYTNMEGRQLERVQQAVTGQTISQDAVPQALLQRVVRELYPEVNTLSGVMMKIEGMAGDPELQKAFLEELQRMTSSDEQLIQTMKAFFTNLSFTDIGNFIDSERGGLDVKKLFSKSDSPETALGNEDSARYSPFAAMQTVGAVESATARKDNKDAAKGGEYLPILMEIDKKLGEFVEKSKDTAIGGSDLVRQFIEEIKKITDTVPADVKRATGLTAASMISPTLGPLLILADRLSKSLQD